MSYLLDTINLVNKIKKLSIFLSQMSSHLLTTFQDTFLTDVQ